MILLGKAREKQTKVEEKQTKIDVKQTKVDMEQAKVRREEKSESVRYRRIKRRPPFSLLNYQV